MSFEFHQSLVSAATGEAYRVSILSKLFKIIDRYRVELQLRDKAEKALMTA